MDYSNQNTDLFNEQPKPLSGTLNVLTILTFIGCGLAYLGLLYNLYTSGNYESQRAKIEEQMDKMGSNNVATKMMEGSLEMMEKTYQYRYVLFISGLVFTTFCLVGALKMRKQQKSGFPIYVIGEIAPVVLTGILIGFSLIGGITTIISAVIALVFVILYSNQRKNLIYN
jgi:hypothetical protein